MSESVFSVHDAIETFLHSFKENTPDEDMALINDIFSLDDERFCAIIPLIKESFEDIINSPKQKVLYAQMFNLDISELGDINEINNFIEVIKEELNSNYHLSEVKCNFIIDMIKSMIFSFISQAPANRATVNIDYEQINECAKEPTYGSDGAAAMDIYSPAEYTIKPGESIIIPTGLKMEVPKGYGLLIQPRSGLSSKTKLRIANTPGLIDSDYRGEIGVIIENIDAPLKSVHMDADWGLVCEYGSSYTIGKGERIAQMRLVESPHIHFTKVSSLSDTERGTGGFGSTGA